MPKDLEFWMIPDEIKSQLTDIFAVFIIKHPDVEVGELVEFIQKYDEITQRWIELDSNSSKN